jgi:short subunit dehydrogenase-like uncharacterized protein
MQTTLLKNFIKKQINKRPAGPSEDVRKNSMSLVWGEVKNSAGKSKTATLEAPDGYTLTAHSSLITIKKLLSGNLKIGYQTPASAYGADLVLEVPGTNRSE